MKKKIFYSFIFLVYLIASVAGIRAGTVSLDTSFNGTGYQIQGFGTTGGLAEGVVVQTDGKIVIGGWTTDDVGEPLSFGAMRFGVNGILDNSFSGDGKVSTVLGSFNFAHSVLFQPDGKILLCGERYSGFTNNDFAVVRYLPDGTLDNSFDGNGIAAPVISGFSDEHSYGALLQPDGKIVMVGTTAPTTTIGQNIPTDLALMRLNTDGSLDTTFSGSGILIVRFDNVNESANTVVLQPDGKIVIGGFLNNAIKNDFLLMRFGANGSLDTSFGSGGLVITSVNGSNDSINSLALQPDGKILAGGWTTGGSAIVRYNSDGSIDTSFANNGIAAATMEISKLLLKPDGKIIAAGTLSNRITVSRFNANGSIDTTFNNTGTFSASGLGSCIGFSAAVQSDDKIVVSGSCYDNFLGLYLMAVIRIKESIRRGLFDFDGDSKTDISIFRPNVGEWWHLRSSDGGNRAAQFGQSTDKITPGDFTGDGKTDIAFWRPSNGFWYILRSEDSSFFSFPFGASGDIPAPADYDGDGKADAAVFRPSSGTWFILNSGGGGTSIVNFGTSEDKPVTADYDGDGKADIAIFRPSDGSWWYLRSSDGQFKVFKFGVSTDKPVQGDYTGDGRADIAVFRPSTGEWFIQRSEDNSYFSFPFGASGDVPVQGDYDGDGKFDAAVFRPSNATWYVNRTTAGLLIVTFGITGDLPVPNAFVP